MSVPFHSTYEEYRADIEWHRKADDFDSKQNRDYWNRQFSLIECGKNHQVKLSHEEYEKRLESKLMERYTVEYMKYQLSQGIHRNPILQDLYDKLESVKPKDKNLWFVTVSFSPDKFNESNLLDLSLIMRKIQNNKKWLDDESNFRWQVEQRNNEDQEGYSGFHIHCTFKSTLCKSRLKTTIARGALKKFIDAENFVDVKKNKNGKVDDNYMECLKKDVNKLRKQVKDREIQLRCPGSLVVPELTAEDWKKIEDHKAVFIA